MTFLYSHAVPQRYGIPTVPKCEVSVILQGNYPLATWNLFWLSNPAIDQCLDCDGIGKYVPVQGLAANVIKDIMADRDLIHAVTCHPLDFNKWFQFEKYQHYFCYLQQGDTWVGNVLERSLEASKRSGFRRDNNVFHVNFRAKE